MYRFSAPKTEARPSNIWSGSKKTAASFVGAKDSANATTIRLGLSLEAEVKSTAALLLTLC